MDAGRYGDADRGLRRAQLPRGHDHGVRPASAKKVIQRHRERRHAGERRRAGNQSRPRRAFSNWTRRWARRSPAACRTASSRSTTSRSRTGRTCGAISAWLARWRPSRASRCGPGRTGPAAGRARPPIEVADRGSRPLPAIQRAGVRERHGGASPLWLQCRLTAIGLNPINNIVDMTNLSWPNWPAHARFRCGPLSGGTIFIRPARSGRTFVALNDEAYTLDPSNLVIADAGGPIAHRRRDRRMETAIGERRGGRARERQFPRVEHPQDVLGVKLRTDASMRFEKAQDPANTVRGWRGRSSCCRSYRRASAWWAGWRTKSGRSRRRRRSTCRWNGWRASWDGQSNEGSLFPLLAMVAAAKGADTSGIFGGAASSVVISSGPP